VARRRPQHASALALLGALAPIYGAGCMQTASGDSFCQLGAEHEVARTSAKDFDAIALVASGDGAVALWSVAGGLFAQPVDARGTARGPRVRVGVRCDGGFDALALPDGLTVACLLHPTRGKHEQPGGVMLHELDRGLRVARTRMIGEAGPQSEGIALASGARGLELAWHDGSPDAHRIFWTTLSSEGTAAPRQVSEHGRMAQAPALTSVRGTTLLAWAENWIDGGKLASRLVIWDRRAPPRTLLERAHVAAMPQLLGLGEQLALGYRDRRGAGAKTGLYLMPAGAHGERLGAAVRVGRADGIGRPALEPCMGGVVAATPRTYGGDYFVGINWLDRTLGRSRGEQQFYEDAHAFTQVSATCLGTHALLLIAEFPQLQHESTALRAAPYRCR
jgi:hypothetical protein